MKDIYDDLAKRQTAQDHRLLKNLTKKYEELLQRRILSNTLHQFMKIELGNIQIEHEKAKIRLTEEFVKKTIAYLEDPKNQTLESQLEIVKA